MTAIVTAITTYPAAVHATVTGTEYDARNAPATAARQVTGA